jgi:GDPmannose 4,6-dehydratase
MLEVIRLRRKPVRFYNAGSSECFGDTGGQAANEQTPFRPRSPYAVAKASAHWLVANYREAYGLYACSGILFNHESSVRPDRFVTQKIVQAAKRIAAGGDERLTLGRLDIKRDWGWAPEYVGAMWKMLQMERPVDLVIATGSPRSLEEFVAAAFAHFGLQWQTYVDTSTALLRPADIGFSCGDPAKALAEIQWTARRKLEEIVAGMATGEI